MPGESKGCGCCCASRICFMVYCGIFALLSLIGIVNFVIPSANTCCSGLTFFLTGEAPSVEAAAYRYCNEFAIENGSSPTALGYTCDDVCMCGGEMCDFTAQAQQHFLGYIIQFGTNLVWIVVLIIGIIVACCKSASGVLCVMIVSTVLFVVQIAGSAIVSAAPNNVIIAFFLWAGAALPDWNGNPTADDDPSGASSWADPLWNCNDIYLATSEAFLQTSSTIQWVFGALFLCIFLHIWFTAYMTMKDIKKGVAGTGTGKPSHGDGVVMGVATAKP